MTSLGPPGDEFGSIAPLDRMTNATADFVFVDEANHSPRLKALNRRRVRSQARSTRARFLMQKHKTGQWKTVSTGLRLLAPQEREHGAFLSYDTSCPLTGLTLRRPTLVGSDKSSPETADTDTSVSQTPCGHRNLEFYNKKFGTTKSNSIGITTSRSWDSPPPSPRGRLGAGRVDPFLSFPLKKPDPDIHNALDLYVTYILPAIFPNDHPYQISSVNTIAKAWLPAAIANPFLFNILLWSICIKRDILRGSKTYRNSAQALVYKVEGIRQLNKVISNGKEGLSDEVILTLAGLATHEVVNFTEEKTKPFNSPLQRAGLLDNYGGLQMVPEHREAILRLVALRGGIENLTLSGLAEGMVTGEICGVMNSCFTLKPVFSPLRLHEPYIAAVKNWAMPASPSSPAQILGRPFRRLPDCGITDTMLEVLSCMEAITMAIDHYLQGKPSGLTLGQIVRTRTGIQKQLLLLPTAKELKIKPSSRPNLYECCRLTAIMFSIAVIYPIPNTYNVLQALVRGLTASLEVMDIESHSVDYSGLLLWMLVLGGIAALEKPERPWFASNLALLSRRDDLRLDWNGAEDILKSFLWLQSACSPGGHQLWDEVMSFTV